MQVGSVAQSLDRGEDAASRGIDSGGGIRKTDRLRRHAARTP
jgi:hypothetical protein